MSSSIHRAAQPDCAAWQLAHSSSAPPQLAHSMASPTPRALPPPCPNSTGSLISWSTLHQHAPSAIRDALELSRTFELVPGRGYVLRSDVTPPSPPPPPSPTLEATLEAEEAESAAVARLACSGRPDPPPKLALCIGGLARTFAHPLVYRSLLGHVLLPFGASYAAVLAHLRLGDVT